MRKTLWRILMGAGAIASIIGVYLAVHYVSEVTVIPKPLTPKNEGAGESEKKPAYGTDKKEEISKKIPTSLENETGENIKSEQILIEKENITGEDKPEKPIPPIIIKFGGSDLNVAIPSKYEAGREGTPFKLYNLAISYLIEENYEEARATFKKILKEYPYEKYNISTGERDELYVKTCECIAVSFLIEGDYYNKKAYYAIAEDKYAYAKQWYARTERETKDRAMGNNYEKFRSLSAFSGLKAAEMMGEGISRPGNPESIKAEAEAYEANADDHEGTDVGMLSLRKAAEAYYKIGNWAEAARVYGKYTKSYPDASDLGEAYKKSAECYENSGEWEKAVKIYLEIADHPKLKGRDVGRESLFKAAFVYEQRGVWITASDLYGRFLSEYPTSPMASEAEYRKSLCEGEIR